MTHIETVAAIKQSIAILRAQPYSPPPLIIVEPGDYTPRSMRERPTRTRRPTLAARQTLPPTLPPRLISRDAAAAYVGVSPNTFDNMIADDLMPKPLQLTERRIAWDVQQLDAAIDRLPVVGGSESETETTTHHSWDDIDAQAKTKPPVH